MARLVLEPWPTYPLGNMVPKMSIDDLFVAFAAALLLTAALDKRGHGRAPNHYVGLVLGVALLIAALVLLEWTNLWAHPPLGPALIGAPAIVAGIYAGRELQPVIRKRDKH